MFYPPNYQRSPFESEKEPEYWVQDDFFSVEGRYKIKYENRHTGERITEAKFDKLPVR